MATAPDQISSRDGGQSHVPDLGRRRRPDGPEYLLYPFIPVGQGITKCPWHECVRSFGDQRAFVGHLSHAHGKSKRDIVWKCRKCLGERHRVTMDNLQSVSKHFPKCPGPMVASPQGEQETDPRCRCPDCGRRFDSYQGRQLHRKRKHPEAYNESLPQPSTRANWSRDDLRDLANAEFDIRCRSSRGHEVNKELVKAFNNRFTMNQIVRAKKKIEYREIYQEIHSERSGQLRPALSPITHAGPVTSSSSSDESPERSAGGNLVPGSREWVAWIFEGLGLDSSSSSSETSTTSDSDSPCGRRAGGRTADSRSAESRNTDEVVTNPAVRPRTIPVADGNVVDSDTREQSTARNAANPGQDSERQTQGHVEAKAETEVKRVSRPMNEPSPIIGTRRRARALDNRPVRGNGTSETHDTVATYAETTVKRTGDLSNQASGNRLNAGCVPRQMNQLHYRETAVKSVGGPSPPPSGQGRERLTQGLVAAEAETAVKRARTPDPVATYAETTVKRVGTPSPNPRSGRARRGGNPLRDERPQVAHANRSRHNRTELGQNQATAERDDESYSRRCRQAAITMHERVCNEGPEVLDNAFAQLCDTAGITFSPPKAGKQRGDRKASALNNRNQRKRERYARQQTYFSRDKKRLLKECELGGRPDVSAEESLPSTADVETVYKERFGSPSPPDEAQFTPVRNGNEMSMGPFSVDEILAGLHGLAWDSAPGRDREVSAKFLKLNLGKHGTRAVMNSFLHARRVPQVLKKNRTILIPKKDGARNVNDFRPITMGSLFLRLYAKLLNTRVTAAIHLDIRQKAFRAVDGCSENLWLLDEVIHTAKRERREVNIVTLDVAKAFDMVSHHSIQRAINRFGLGRGFGDIVHDLYQGVTTRITGSSGETCEIPMTRGVKQGCPLSPTLFNMVTDELLHRIGTAHMFKLGAGQGVNALAFADDLVLASGSVNGMDHLLRKTESFFHDRHMTVNAAKSHAIRMVPVPKHKCLKTITGATFKYGGEPITNSRVTEVVKYLGLEMSALGTPRLARDVLTTTLRGLTRTALKPQQKIAMLRSAIMPAMAHRLRLAKVDAGTLRGISRDIRKTARDILHLPPGTPTRFFHIKEKEGGLNLPELERTVPITRIARITALRRSEDPAVRLSAQLSQRLARELASWQALLHTRSDTPSELRAELKNKRRRELAEFRQTRTGSLFRDASKSTSRHDWIRTGNGLSGRQYVLAVHAITEQLPTRVNIHRGVEGMPLPCRRCHQPGETQLHALNGCRTVKDAMIRRHNWVASRVTSLLENSGATVLAEPTFTCRGSLLKPDLLVLQPDKVTIVDIAVPYDNVADRLESRYLEKVEKYGPILAKAQRQHGKSRGEVLAVVIGSRGLTLRQTTDEPLRNLGIGGTKTVRDLSTGVLRGSMIIWSMFANGNRNDGVV